MIPSLSTNDLVQLPRLGPEEAVALGREMLAAAAAHAPLPDGIERARVRLASAIDMLDTALRDAPPPPSDPFVRRRADRALDLAWEATFDWLSGWCKLADEANPNRGRARSLFSLIFPDALAFTKLPYRTELAESQARLDAIRIHKHEETFEALGGEAFLDHLREAQEVYGRALLGGPTSSSSGGFRELVVAVAGALRQYVVRIVSSSDPLVAGSERAADALLRPLATFHAANPSRAPEIEFGSVDEKA